MPSESKARAGVLIVDDEPDNLSLLARTLRTDAQIYVARTAEEGRRVLADTALSVVVSDHRLPGEDGVSLLTHVASMYPLIGRVLVTAYGESASVVAACNSGIVQRFFIKPYAPLALQAAVQDLLRARSAVPSPTVLLVDLPDDVLPSLRESLAKRSISVAAVSGALAAGKLKAGEVDCVLVDTRSVDALKLLHIALECDPVVPVIAMSSGGHELAINLLEAGAFDFAGAPFQPAEIALRVERALSSLRQAREHKRLLSATQSAGGDVIAESQAMRRVLEVAASAARHDITILVTGETGSGKDVVAKYIHGMSRRAEGPFVVVNCGAIPEPLIESTLFGHERGAFTDAKERRAGVFEAAHGGTLFLDEIGELPLSAQVRLLRVLETQEFNRVGATTPIRADVRVIGATHRDLQAMVQSGQFRQDLYYRVSGMQVHLPPLRERRDDIPALLHAAVARFAEKNGMPPPRLGSGALQQAMSYPWPGNVRELVHVVHRAMITSSGPTLDTLELSAPSASAAPVAAAASSTAELQVDDNLPMEQALAPIILDLERRYLEKVIERCQGQLGRAAEHAGIHRKSLYNKLKRLSLETKRGS